MKSIKVTLVLLVSLINLMACRIISEFTNLPQVNFSLASAEPEDVIYKLFKSSEPYNNSVTLCENTLQFINTSWPVKILIHGWTTDDTSPWYIPLKDAYLAQEPCNVIFLNWSKAGNRTYPVSAANVRPVGNYIAEFLEKAEIPPKNIHLIGHSLGSQLASYIAKFTFNKTQTKISRITALDPAGPMFEHPDLPADYRLNKNDAEFVDVHHTDIGHYGMIHPCGHIDYYANEGYDQPGCPSLAIDDNCSHARSTLFFIESLHVKNATAVEAAIVKSPTEGFKVNPTPNGRKIIFGEHVNKCESGVFQIRTHERAPYFTVE